MAERVGQTVEAHPEVRARYEDLPAPSPKAAVLAVLPGDRCDGALLPYDTWGHWALAAASAAGFSGLVWLLFPPGQSKLWHLAAVGTFTGTASIVLLLALQFLAFHVGFVVPRGAVTLLWDLVALIGQSYRMALDDRFGSPSSALGFTAGVGFCEEACKARPLLFKVRTTGFRNRRSALLWGLTSGVGFGLSEGITYASTYYNGILGGQIYAVRFVSCVALHGIWAAAVGVAVYRNRAGFLVQMNAFKWIGRTLRVVIVPMCLHGPYDTLLKQQYDAAALGVALASFGWLAVQIELAKRRLDPANAAASRGSTVGAMAWITGRSGANTVRERKGRVRLALIVLAGTASGAATVVSLPRDRVIVVRPTADHGATVLQFTSGTCSEATVTVELTLVNLRPPCTCPATFDFVRNGSPLELRLTPIDPGRPTRYRYTYHDRAAGRPVRRPGRPRSTTPSPTRRGSTTASPRQASGPPHTSPALTARTASTSRCPSAPPCVPPGPGPS